MITSGYLSRFPRIIKKVLLLFLVVLSVGYGSGVMFVFSTTSASPVGVSENYLGNEENEEAEVMKFRKSDREMYSIIHTHILSMSVIFLILSLLVFGTEIDDRLKHFLMIEPLVSVLLTFGGIFFVWKGYELWTYIVMISGVLMHLSYLMSVIIIGRSLLARQN